MISIGCLGDLPGGLRLAADRQRSTKDETAMEIKRPLMLADPLGVPVPRQSRDGG